MKTPAITLFILGIIFSCTNTGNQVKEAGIKTDSGTNVMGTNNAYTDTPLWVLPESFKKIQSQFKVFDKFPYVMDSLFFQKLENSNPNPFPGEIIAALSQNHQSASMFGGPEYDIKICIQIDSIKQFSDYDAWVSTSDIGMVVESDAYPLHQITFDNNITGYTWFIRYSTTDACPFGQGTIVFLTLVSDNNVLACTQIADQSGGADAPYWSDNTVYGKLTKQLQISGTKTMRSGGDMDENGNDIVEQSANEFRLVYENRKWIEK